MKKYTLSLIIAFLFLTSCKDDDKLLLTPDLVIELKAFDLDNNGNSSDIRVDFEVGNNLNVNEYRVMVLQSIDRSFFDMSIAQSISSDNYLIIFPIPFETKYPINRMPTNFIDVSGAQITNDIEYVVVILVEGVDDFQLSGFSRPFTLLNIGIYSGAYDLNFARQNYIVDSAVIAGSGDNYVGRIFGEDPINVLGDCGIEPFFDLGPISFKITGNTISEWLWQHKVSIPCEIIIFDYIGDGVIVNETTLRLKPSDPEGPSVTEFFLKRK